MLKLFGIPNCDTVKKSKKWLDSQGIKYEFHDFKKQGITKLQLAEWCKQLEWEALLNKRSQTWKKLTEADRTNVNQIKAISLMQAHPTLIKRPVAQQGKNITVGFDKKIFKAIFK